MLVGDWRVQFCAMADGASRLVAQEGITVKSGTFVPRLDVTSAMHMAEETLINDLADEAADLEAETISAATLVDAAASGVEALSTLFEEGALAADVRDTHHRTALMHCAAQGWSDCITALLANDADVNRLDLKGSSPLLYAAHAGSTDCVRLLLDAQADVDTADREGCTPLLACCRHGHAQCVDLLLHARADVGLAVCGPVFKAILSSASGGTDETGTYTDASTSAAVDDYSHRVSLGAIESSIAQPGPLNDSVAYVPSEASGEAESSHAPSAQHAQTLQALVDSLQAELRAERDEIQVQQAEKERQLRNLELQMASERVMAQEALLAKDDELQERLASMDEARSRALEDMRHEMRERESALVAEYAEREVAREAEMQAQLSESAALHASMRAQHSRGASESHAAREAAGDELAEEARVWRARALALEAQLATLGKTGTRRAQLGAKPTESSSQLPMRGAHEDAPGEFQANALFLSEPVLDICDKLSVEEHQVHGRVLEAESVAAATAATMLRGGHRGRAATVDDEWARRYGCWTKEKPAMPSMALPTLGLLSSCYKEGRTSSGSSPEERAVPGGGGQSARATAGRATDRPRMKFH